MGKDRFLGNKGSEGDVLSLLQEWYSRLMNRPGVDVVSNGNRR